MTYTNNPLEGPSSDVYAPIDPNPNVQADAGYENTVPPPPPPGAEVLASQSGAHPGFMQVPQVSRHLHTAVAGAVGAAIFGITGSGTKKVSLSEMGKGAIAGAVIAMLMARRVQGQMALALSAAGGYVVARWVR